MEWRIASGVAGLIRGHTARSAPEEACGLLVGRPGIVARAVVAANAAADPQRRFAVDGQTLFDAHRAARAEGLAVVGCYHSHPGGGARPSAVDAAAAHDLGWLWLIDDGNAITGWETDAHGPVQGRFAPAPLLWLD